MNFPPFVSSAAFWKALSLVVAGLVVAFSDFKLEAVALETLIFAILELFGVKPELMAKGLSGAWFKRN